VPRDAHETTHLTRAHRATSHSHSSQSFVTVIRHSHSSQFLLLFFVVPGLEQQAAWGVMRVAMSCDATGDVLSCCVTSHALLSHALLSHALFCHALWCIVSRILLRCTLVSRILLVRVGGRISLLPYPHTSTLTCTHSHTHDHKLKHTHTHPHTRTHPLPHHPPCCTGLG